MYLGSVQKMAASRIAAEEFAEHRWVDIAIDLRDWGDDPKAKKPNLDTSESLLYVGGVWDRKLKRWAEDREPERVLTWHAQPGQYAAVEWFADWLAAYMAGERLEGFEDVYSLLYAGGRRGGKSDSAVKLLTCFAVAVPGSIVWAVAPTDKKTNELRRILQTLPHGTSPFAWGRWSGGGRKLVLWTGTEIELKTGFDGDTVKDGRADCVLLNEAQMIENKAYRNVRAPLADCGGICVATCNPPEDEIGYWVQDVYDSARAGADTWRLFEFDAKNNPTVDHRALEVMADDPAIGELEFRREILGEMVPVGDRVLHSWSPRLNVRPVPDDHTDVTERETERVLGYRAPFVGACDFQILPHEVATIWKIYEGPDGVTAAWAVAEVVVEGDENALADAIERTEVDGVMLTPELVPLICDASGEFQDAERSQRGSSHRYLRNRGYRVFNPDPEIDKNPPILDTVRTANAMAKTSSGHRRLNAVPSCIQVCRSAARWKNNHGKPKKNTEYSHIGDTIRYFAHRLFPRNDRITRFSVEWVKPDMSDRARDLAEL